MAPGNEPLDASLFEAFPDALAQPAEAMPGPEDPGLEVNAGVELSNGTHASPDLEGQAESTEHAEDFIPRHTATPQARLSLLTEPALCGCDENNSSLKLIYMKSKRPQFAEPPLFSARALVLVTARHLF